MARELSIKWVTFDKAEVIENGKWIIAFYGIDAGFKAQNFITDYATADFATLVKV